ncbi:tRNA(Ile)-lysidine synthase [Metamycoplasma auris 15026]|uniref:tRNA(Ile)-lysidine synthase n=1 Tax=Metamycoplasma auris 15026 TaxID=1188233 RepID=N9TT66_9BACT|nr:tRNA lysidine(34) synthetase TilS [Metamycoplasma auris]ENY69240.1 tRNA(Ile)-lysidine synthase [Metamycoplasma auris 15026]
MNSNIDKIQTLFFNEFAKNKIDLNQTFILGISGGPDSMWMLNLMKKKNIIVACVNYNHRENSDIDQKIVEDFCAKHHIKYELLILKKEDEKEVGNFQKIARNQRYLFYAQVYKKYDADCLLLAHQKDDLIETYLFQKQTKRNPSFFGIKQTNKLHNMNIFRPMLHLWYKNEIIDFCATYNIPYAIDYTNNLPIYTRNKIRLELKKISNLDKDLLAKQISEINSKLTSKNKEIETKYLFFEDSFFSYKTLDFNDKDINEILFMYLHKNIADLKLSKNKIESFKKFLLSQKNYKAFLVNDNTKVIKDKGFLKIIKTPKN